MPHIRLARRFLEHGFWVEVYNDRNDVLLDGPHDPTKPPEKLLDKAVMEMNTAYAFREGMHRVWSSEWMIADAGESETRVHVRHKDNKFCYEIETAPADGEVWSADTYPTFDQAKSEAYKFLSDARSAEIRAEFLDGTEGDSFGVPIVSPAPITLSYELDETPKIEFVGGAPDSAPATFSSHIKGPKA